MEFITSLRSVVVSKNEFIIQNSKVEIGIKTCFLIATCFHIFATPIDANILPEFVPKEDILVLTIPEGKNYTAGTAIHKFRGFDQDGDILTFTISGEPSVREQFRLSRISNTESNLVLKRDLDRERMSDYIVEVSLSDGRTMRVAQQSILIIVADVNDNSPLFKPFNDTIALPENSQVPKLITLLEATDADEGPNSEIGFSLQVEQEDQPFFNLTQTDNGQAAIYLMKPFDYERKSQHKVSIIAYDNPLAENPRETKISLTIDVQNVDENVPFFNILPTNNTVIREDIPFGSEVFQVEAVLGISQTSSLIQYELLTETKKFTIESHTGRVRTNMFFNREDPPATGTYYLRIKARLVELPGERSEAAGRTNPNSSTETTLKIEILDVDESPKFRNESYQGLVPENSLEGYPILFKKWLLPQVYDHDMGGKTLVKLRIEGDGGILEVMPSQGYGEFLFQFVVKDPRRLDYEQLQEIVFRLIAEDETGHTRTSHCSVGITDVNDNYPVFSQDLYYIRIPENSPAGSEILYVSAIDRDKGRYGAQGIRYKILSGEWSPDFKLDSKTGQLTVGNSTVLDREQNAKIYLTIEAQDNFGSGNRNFTTVSIKLKDENDNAPQFTQTHYEAEVTENTKNIFLPLKIFAIDADEPGTQNSKVAYRIYLGENTSQFWLDLDPLTHQLLIKEEFDFEELAKVYGPVQAGSVGKLLLNFTIEAFDFGVPQQTSRTNLTLIILDDNDCAPQFSKTYHEVTIPKNPGSEVEIFKVNAIDFDVSPRFHQVEYKLARESASHTFRIDSISGIITPAPGVNFEQSSYTLEVSARDGLGLQSEVNCMINLTIEDVHNKSPYFLFPQLHDESCCNNGVTWDTVRDSYLRLISPDFKPGTEILQLKSPNNAGRREGSGFSILNPVYFHTIQQFDRTTFATLTEDLVFFAIDPDTGSIQLNVALPEYLTEGSFIFHVSLPSPALVGDANPQYAQIEIFVMEYGQQLTLPTNLTAVEAEQQAENLSADLSKFFNLDVAINMHSFLGSGTTVFKLLISDLHNPLEYGETYILLANSAEKLAPLFEKYKIVWDEIPLETGAKWDFLKSGKHFMIEDENSLYLCCMVGIYVVGFLLWMLVPPLCLCGRDEETERYETKNLTNYHEIIVGTGEKTLPADVGKEIFLDLQARIGETDC